MTTTTNLHTDARGHRYWIEDGHRVELIAATSYDLGPIVGRVLYDFAVYGEMAVLDTALGPIPTGDFERRWARHLADVLAGTGWTPDALLAEARRRTSARWTHAVGLDDAIHAAVL